MGMGPKSDSHTHYVFTQMEFLVPIRESEGIYNALCLEDFLLTFDLQSYVTSHSAPNRSRLAIVRGQVCPGNNHFFCLMSQKTKLAHIWRSSSLGRAKTSTSFEHNLQRAKPRSILQK